MKEVRPLRALLFGVLLAALIVFAVPKLAHGVTEHCPDGGVKVEGESNDTVLESGTVFCVKAGPEASGELVADGESTLLDYVTWTVGDGNTPDVSHYTLYHQPEPTPTTTPTTEPTSSPTPTLAPPSTLPTVVVETVPPTVSSASPLAATGAGEVLWLVYFGVSALVLGFAIRSISGD